MIWLLHVCTMHYMDTCVSLYMRDSNTQKACDIRRQKDTAAHKRRRSEESCAVQSIQNVSQMFTSAIKECPDYVCTCCHRLMYRKTVVEFYASKYSKVSGQLMRILFSSKFLCASAKGKVWVCKTCHFTKNACSSKRKQLET